jgi:hypothetical protein
VADELEPIRWKIGWARNHLQAFHTLAQQWIAQSDFWTPKSYQDRKGRLVLGVKEVRPFPNEMLLHAGDCAHNLRSALDHLAFLICKPKTEQRERAVEFPITSSYAKFRGTGSKMPNAPRGYRTAVERLQPYHRRVHPEAMALWHLQEINNWDKHRRLLAAAASLQWSNINVRFRGATSIENVVQFQGMFKPGAILARIEMGYSEVGAEVGVDPELALTPVFDDGMPKRVQRLPILGTLRNAADHIETTVLPELSQFV